MVVVERAVMSELAFSSACTNAGRLTNPAVASASVHLFTFIRFLLRSNCFVFRRLTEQFRLLPPKNNAFTLERLGGSRRGTQEVFEVRVVWKSRLVFSSSSSFSFSNGAGFRGRGRLRFNSMASEHLRHSFFQHYNSMAQAFLKADSFKQAG